MNESKLKITNTKYSIGSLIHHKLFDYRGVIVDIDPEFQLTDEWYEMVARSRPPKDEPWYHVLVHDATNSTYVAEQNLEPDLSNEEINHPMTDRFFIDFKNGRYLNDEKIN
jgi:heat shock protein HspQ